MSIQKFCLRRQSQNRLAACIRVLEMHSHCLHEHFLAEYIALQTRCRRKEFSPFHLQQKCIQQYQQLYYTINIETLCSDVKSVQRNLIFNQIYRIQQRTCFKRPSSDTLITPPDSFILKDSDVRSCRMFSIVLLFLSISPSEVYT